MRTNQNVRVPGFGAGRMATGTGGWGLAVTMMNDRRRLNCKANDTGVLLHDLTDAELFARNAALCRKSHKSLCCYPRRIKERLGIPIPGKPSPSNSNGYTSKDLALTDSEYLGTTLRADTLGRWLSVLHGYSLGVLHLPLGAALHAVCFHSAPPLFSPRLRHSLLHVKQR